MSETGEKTVIQVKNISKDFALPHEKVNTVKSHLTRLFRSRTTETQHALKKVSFQIKKGEFFGIVGRNGGGKSTLLKILAGIYQPTSGSIEVQGKLVPFIELGVGFNPELTGRENVYLNGALLGFSKKEMDAQYEKIVAFAELEDFMDQKLKNYSSGMQVRLAFSVAIIADADILLVDEVLAVGDADFKRKCFQYFKALKRKKKTVVFVSHDMNAVREYCDRAILIKDGRVFAQGKAERIAQDYLQLFNEGYNKATEPEESPKEDSRWGNRWAFYKELACKLTANSLTIEASVKAQRDLNDVVFGFRIRNDAGEEILGTNSDILGLRNLTLTKGQIARMHWQVPNIFSNGIYWVEPALVLSDGTTVCDWWNEAKQIKILKQESTSYPVTPNIEFNIGENRGKA